jgi:hypothetical protein
LQWLLEILNEQQKLTFGGMKRWGFRSYFTIMVQRTLMQEQKLE